MTALTFIGYLALLALIAFALLLGNAVIQLLNAVAEHRSAQADSVLKHAGLIDTGEVEVDED